MNRKYLNAEVEIKSTHEAGSFSALASTPHVDRQGDRVIPGAFAASLRQWRLSGAALPVLWNHSSSDPRHFIGEVTDARETDRGLEIDATLDLDDELGRKAHKLLKSRAVKAMSIGYVIVDERRGTDGINELHELELHEVSVVLTPANREALIHAVKHDGEATTTREHLAAQLAELGVSTKRTRSDELHVATFEVAR